MKILFDERAIRELGKLSQRDKAHIRKYLKLLKEFGSESRLDFKKIDKNVWELKIANVRMFFLKIKSSYICIHIMVKKSQKITKKTHQTILNRTKEYL